MVNLTQTRHVVLDACPHEPRHVNQLVDWVTLKVPILHPVRFETGRDRALKGALVLNRACESPLHERLDAAGPVAHDLLALDHGCERLGCLGLSMPAIAAERIDRDRPRFLDAAREQKAGEKEQIAGHGDDTVA